MDRTTLIKRCVAGVGALGLGATTAFLFSHTPPPDSDPSGRATTVRDSSTSRLSSLRLDRSGIHQRQSYVGMPRFGQKISVEHFFALRTGSRTLFDTHSFDLAGDISEHFGLTPEEIPLIRAELKELYSDLRIIESKNARLTQDKKGKDCIEITPSPEIQMRTDAFIKRLTDNFADPKKGSELAQLIVTNPNLAGGNFTQQVSIEQRSWDNGIKYDCLKRLIYDENGYLVNAVWLGLEGSPSVKQAYEPIFSTPHLQER